MVWYDEKVARVFSFLDSKDLSGFIDKYKGHEVEELMEVLEMLFNYTDEDSCSLFDYVAEDEFIIYIRERYKASIKEEVTIKNYIR